MEEFKDYKKESMRSLSKSEALQEANRCLLCHDAPCNKGCPANTNPSGFIRAIKFENFVGAGEIIRKANILGSTCARTCPCSELCKKDCTRGKIDTPIEIGLLQKFATDYEESKKIENLKKVDQNREKVGIIGSGPAGLASAASLALKGYQVTVFEKDKVLGGVLATGVIPSRLPIDVVDSEINRVRELGVSFVANCEVGKDVTINELEKQGFEAFVLASGCPSSAKSDIFKNVHHCSGIHSALNFLYETKCNKKNFVKNRNVVVIGAGDVALDAALTSKHLGAKHVSVLYRRRLEDMPSTKEELDCSRESNIDFYTNFTPTKYEVAENKIISVCAKGTYDASEIVLDADICVEAIGQVPYDVKKIFKDIKLDEKGYVKTVEGNKTNIKNVFAAGDINTGCETVVLAVKDGKNTADIIERYFLDRKDNYPKFNIKKANEEKSLEIDFCGVKCQNPFFLASSPVGSNYEMCKKALEGGWGGIYYKTVGFFIADECSPRFDAVGKNSSAWGGFKNMEQISDKPLEKNLESISKLKKEFPEKVMVASIMGAREDEWTNLAKMVTEAGADLIECNFSCPQMTSHSMGSDVGQNPELVKLYSAATRRGTHLPVIAKMTPNIGNMEIPAIAAVEGGATGLSAINTIKSITNIDLDKLICLPSVNGKSSISGYSGKAVRPIALRFVAQLAKEAKLKNIPISGIGGIETWQDAVEFFLVGASNLQVTTSIMQYGYRIVEDMKSGMMSYLKIKKFSNVRELIGLALRNIIPAEELDRDFKIIPDVDLDKCIGCGRCYLSCYDGAFQAIDWNESTRKPSINDNCVGCHLCMMVCPIDNCIHPGEIKFKHGRKMHDVVI